jgi:molecular chaperone GrpE
MTGHGERPEEDTTVSPETGSEEDQSAADSESGVAAGDRTLEEQLAELQAKADENWDKYLRAAAELENARKRAVRDVEHARKYALERFGNELLSVRDSLEMGLEQGEQVDVASLREGSEATLKILSRVMEQFGIEQLDPLGEPFDPSFHEAMMMQPSADSEPGSVLTVFQKGYSLNGRLLRPARVVVAAEMPKGEAE